MRVIRGKHVNVLVVCNELCVIGPLSLVGLIGHSGRPGIGEIAEPGPAALAGSVGAAHWPACLGGPEAGASRGWWCRDWWCRGARCAGRDRHTETAGGRCGDVVSLFGHSAALMAQVPHFGRHFILFCPRVRVELAPYVAAGYRLVRISPARSGDAGRRAPPVVGESGCGVPCWCAGGLTPRHRSTALRSEPGPASAQPWTFKLCSVSR